MSSLISKQAGALLGQAQLKLGLDFNSNCNKLKPKVSLFSTR